MSSLGFAPWERRQQDRHVSRVRCCLCGEHPRRSDGICVRGEWYCARHWSLREGSGAFGTSRRRPQE